MPRPSSPHPFSIQSIDFIDGKYTIIRDCGLGLGIGERPERGDSWAELAMDGKIAPNGLKSRRGFGIICAVLE